MSIQVWADAARQDKYRQDPEHQAAIAAIKSVLEGTKTSDDAARTIAGLYNPLLADHPQVSPVATLWVVICEAARLLGGDNELADRLVRLVNSLSKLPDVIDKHGKAVSAPWKSAGSYWKDLPEFAMIFREYGIGKTPDGCRS